MDLYTIYRKYLANPSVDKEELLYTTVTTGAFDDTFLNVPSLAQVPSFRLFKVFLNNYKGKSYQRSLLLALLNKEDRFEHLKYLFELFPSLNELVILTNSLEEARLQALQRLVHKQECIVYFQTPILIREAIPYGLFPYDLRNTIQVLENPDVPLETLKHYYNDKTIQEEIYAFRMATEAVCRRVQKSHSSTVLFRWFYPHLLYSSSREKTDMGMFRTPFSNIGVVKETSLIVATDYYNLLPLQEGLIEGHYYVPVTRYASSVQAGLYHDLPTEEYCGTFYYWEEESATCLVANSFLVAQTKYAATKYVYNNLTKGNGITVQVEIAINEYLENSVNEAWENGYYKPDLMYTPGEVADMIGDVGYQPVPEVSLYYGEMLDLYAQEDVFDQPLCLIAQEAGIELVILTRMVGSRQIVKEVLDVRTREESFRNLVFT